MYKRDLIIAEIQKLGQALKQLLGLQEAGKQEEADLGLQEVLEQEYGILYTDLIASEAADFTAFLEEKDFASEKLEMLSQFLYLKFNPSEKNSENDSLAEKLQLIYRRLEVKHKVVNMSNLSRQSSIAQYLKA